MLNIKLPALYCPFPAAISQYVEVVGQHNLEWVRSFNLVTGESGYQLLHAAYYHGLAARAYANSSLEALELYCDYMVWIFIVDDQFEEAGITKQPEQLEPEHMRLVDILKGTLLADVNRPAEMALQNILYRVHQFLHTTSDLMLRFIKNWEDYFQGVRWEVLNHSQGITPNLATYMKMRPMISGLYPFFDLILIGNRIPLPLEVLEHPIVKRLNLAANNVVAWANDIFSLEKEIRKEQTHNLVLVLQHEYQIPLQDALDRAAEHHDAEVQTFIELSSQLPSFESEIDANLQHYLSGLRSWMRGNMDWYQESLRY